MAQEIETKLDYETFDESYFVSAAEVLLNKCRLMINGKPFRLVEIEFYLKSPHHSDPYTHCNPDQLLMHTFYFHKFHNGSYKGGTYKGMDLTFGDANAEVYFGILIRAIQDTTDGTIIEGPCKTVDRILLEYGYPNLIDLTQNGNLNIFHNEHQFVLERTDDFEQSAIASGPRIGLSNKYPDFRNRPYRFVIFRDRIKKEKSKLVYVDEE